MCVSCKRSLARMTNLTRSSVVKRANIFTRAVTIRRSHKQQIFYTTQRHNLFFSHFYLRRSHYTTFLLCEGAFLFIILVNNKPRELFIKCVKHLSDKPISSFIAFKELYSICIIIHHHQPTSSLNNHYSDFLKVKATKAIYLCLNLISRGRTARTATPTINV